MKLADKVAIITGSGRGIGRAAALMFAASGAKVVVSDIDVQPADETAKDIQKAEGRSFAYVGDVTAGDFAEDIVKAAVDTFGGLHIIVNNAGYAWDGVIQNITDKMWNAMMDIHITAQFRIIRAASSYFRDAAKKEIAIVLSDNAKRVSIRRAIRGGYHANHRRSYQKQYRR